MTLLHRVALLAAYAALCACATVPGQTDWADHRASTLALQDWTAFGKIALRSETQSDTASFTWRQRADRFNIDLSGPFGAGSAVIAGDRAELSITRGASRESYTGPQRNRALAHAGWQLPLDALPFWVRGVPAPGSPVETLQIDEERGVALAFKQNGWRLNAQDYQRVGSYSLPTRITAESGERKVTVLVRRWLTDGD